jgi:hypothetical protein
MRELKEADAAKAYAKAWNCLEPETFTDLLAPDALYASPWVFEEMTGKEQISDYLVGKMETVQRQAVSNKSLRVLAELGKTTKSFPDRDCVILFQGDSDKAKAAVLFEIDWSGVKCLDLCIPDLLGLVHSGIYPD